MIDGRSVFGLNFVLLSKSSQKSPWLLSSRSPLIKGIIKRKALLIVGHFVVGRFTVVIVYNRSKRLWYKRCCPTIVGKLASEVRLTTNRMLGVQASARMASES